MFLLLRDIRVVALLFTATLTILSNSLISPALPGIKTAFQDQPDADLLVRLLITAPSLVVAIMAPFAGALIDRFGRRRQMLWGVVIFAVAGTAGLWLPSLDAILLSRLLLGASLALIMTAQTAFIGEFFSCSQRARFMSLQIASTNFGGFLFLLFAGWLATQSTFLPFAIYAIGLLYLPVIWIGLTEDTHRPRPLNTKNTELEHVGEARWRIKICSIVALSAFSLIGFYLVPTQIPFYLEIIGHAEPAAVGTILGVLMLSGAVVSLTYSRLRQRLGRGLTPMLGFAFFTVGFVTLSFAKDMTSAMMSAVFIGGATGLLFPIFLSITIEVAPFRRRGIVSGAVTTSIFMGQFLSPIISQPIIDAIGFSKTFILTGGLFATLGVLAFFTLREKPR